MILFIADNCDDWESWNRNTMMIVLLFTFFDNLFLIIYLIEKKSIHFVEIIFLSYIITVILNFVTPNSNKQIKYLLILQICFDPRQETRHSCVNIWFSGTGEGSDSNLNSISDQRCTKIILEWKWN